MNENEIAIAGAVAKQLRADLAGQLMTEDQRKALDEFTKERAAAKEREVKVQREAETEALNEQLRGDRSFRAYASDVKAKTAEEIKERVVGSRFARYCRALVVGAKSGKTPEQQLRFWGSRSGGGATADKIMADELKARSEEVRNDQPEDTRALSIQSLSAGGVLVPTSWSGEMIPILRNAAVVDQLPGIRHVNMPGSDLVFTKQIGAATAFYLGENVQVTASDQAFADRKLSRRKLVSMTAFSNSLLRVADQSVDGIVRDDLLQVMALRRDLAFLRGDGASDTPRGLRYWASAGNVQAQTGTTAATKVADYVRPQVRLRAQNIPISPQTAGYAFSSRTWGALFTTLDANSNPVFQPMMLGNQIYLYPFVVSNQIPETLGGGSDSESYFVHGPSVLIGDGLEADVQVSSEASYFDGSSLISLFTRDMSAIRVIMEHDLIALYDEGIHVTTGVTIA
jgi:HK97 family phage major capsid protein